ncbi:MAG: hypothetical protein RJA22_2325 [Verrucomicrobiota bacterium]
MVLWGMALSMGALSAAELPVGTPLEVAVAGAQARPGDTLVMRDGEWRDADIVISAHGTPTQPITLRARTLGRVHLTGVSRLRIAGSWIVVDGLTFTNGYVSSGDVIGFQETTFNAASFSRITNCAIVNYNPPNGLLDTKWVSLYGFSNRVENCYFQGKTNLGTTLVVWVDADPNKPGYHYIGRNYFGPRPPLGVNGGEAIRVGTSDVSLNNSRTTVEYNLFDRYNGDAEIISSKSCENRFRFNTFLECEGALSLRHGNRCVVEGNFFFGRGKPLTGGVRVVGEDHLVHNNYFSELTGTSARSPLSLMQGMVNSPLSGYAQVHRAVVAYNTFHQCTNSLMVGLVGTLTGTTNVTTLPPVDCVIANNIVVQAAGKLVDQRIDPVNLRWEGNIMFGAALGIPDPGGILIADPLLFLGADGLMRLNPASPAVGAGQGSYPQAANDFDGQPRTVPPDVGADQISVAPISNKPLVLSDVGPLWQRTTGTVLSWTPPASITYGTPLSSLQLSAVANAAGSFSYTPAAGTILPAGSGRMLSVVFTPVDGVAFNSVTQSVSIDVLPAMPPLVWTNPPALSYGGSLSVTQLNATAGIPGTFTYVPPAGTMLPVGNSQVLAVIFTPGDTSNYVPVTRTVLLNVVPARPPITWNTPADLPEGTPLSGVQLNAASPIPGSFVYQPPSGTMLAAGSAQLLTAIFTPTDPGNYLSVTQSVRINVTSGGRLVPIVSWPPPADMVAGTALGPAQLNATANVPGTFTYNPPAGAQLPEGNGQWLTATFVPADPAFYTSVSVSNRINVAPPVGSAVVRVAYLVPSNRVPSPKAAASLQSALLHYQDWFRDQMALNGFGPKTFALEPGPDGVNPVVHTFLLGVTDNWLRQDSSGARLLEAARAAGVPMGTNGQVWWLVPEMHQLYPDGTISGQMALSSTNGGFGDQPSWAVTSSDVLALLEPTCLTNASFYHGLVLPELGPYALEQDITFSWFDGSTISSIGSSSLGAGLRQLGEAFGLDHDYRHDENFYGNLMGFGFRGIRGSFHPKQFPYNGTRLSHGAALALSVNHYFNPGRPLTDTVRPAITLTSGASLQPADGLLTLAFSATDDRALHAAFLAVDRGGEWAQIDEVSLAGTSAEQAFVTPYFEPGRTNLFRLSVLDSLGNRAVLTAAIRVESTLNRAPRPFIRVSPRNAGPGEEVAFDASATFDPEHVSDLLEAEWDFDNDGVFDTPASTQMLVTNRFLTLGTRMVRLRVSDSSGATAVSDPFAIEITPCEAVLSPASRFHGYGAGSGSVSVTTSPNCQWSVVNTNSWITLTSPTNMTGPGSVSYALAANPVFVERSGTLRLGDAVYTIIQRAASCAYSFSPVSRYHGYAAGTGTVRIVTSSNCSWTLVNTNPWVTITSPLSGTGSATIAYSVAENRVGQPRLGSLAAEGVAFVVGQWGTNCSYLLSAASREHSEMAETGSVAVTASSSCNWTVVNPSAWVTVESPLSTNGSAAVLYRLAPNLSGQSRTAILTIAGQSFSLTQRACGYSLSRPSRVHGFGAETGSVSLATGDLCPWTVVNTNSWILVTGGRDGGVGSGVVSYTVAGNASTMNRSGILMIGGQPYAITQLGVPCDYEVLPDGWNHGEGAELNEVLVRAGTGCAWSVSNPNSWITILAGAAGSGTGSVIYSVAPNPGPARQGIIQIAGQDFAVGQVSGQRRLAVGELTVANGQTACVPITFGARGTENSLAFSLCFPTSALAFASATLGNAAFGGSLLVNSNEASAGRVGFTIAMPPGWSMPAGTQAVVEVCLRGTLPAGKLTAPLVLCDQPQPRQSLDAVGQVLSLDYVNGSARIIGDCSLAESLDATDLAWTTSTATAWVCQTNAVRDFEDAAASALVPDGGESWVQTTVVGPGTLAWWWKVSCEPNDSDRLRFYLNGSGQFSISGEVDWEFRTYDLGPGTHTVRWRYYKNSTLSVGQDQGWLDEVTFQPAPPRITVEPPNLFVQATATATWTVGVTGTPPLTYQWRRNGVNLVNGPGVSGADTATLTLSGVQMSQAGGYSLVINNLAGSATTREAQLTVTPFISLADALDADLGWTTNGAPFWTGRESDSRDGVDAAQSGPIGDSGSSSIQAVLVGPGTLSFWWKVSSQTNGDYLRLYLGTTQLTNLSGEVDWTRHTMAVPAGSQIVRWTYQKNSSLAVGQDRAWVDEVAFQPAPPAITAHPVSQVIDQGAGVSFSVVANGSAPLSYAWFQDGVELVNGPGVSGSATPTLSLTNVPLERAGQYSVRVMNPEGSVFSSNATLTVGRLVPLADALDAAGPIWTTAGNLPWIGQTAVARDGVDAGRSGLITHSQSSSLLTTVGGPGTVSFWWKVSSETNSDRLRFYVDGSQVAEISGEVAWQWRTFALASGARSLEWRYTKNSSTSVGLDRGWIDQVVVVTNSVPTPPTIGLHPVSRSAVAPATVTFGVGAVGSAPLGYQWQFNGVNLTNGAGISGATTTNLVVVASNATWAGAYSVVVSNAAGLAVSDPAELVVISAPVITNRPADRHVVAGSNVVFTVGAVGTAPLGYHWQLNGQPLTNGGRFSGATTATLTISAVTAAQEGVYSVLVSNAAGTASSALGQIYVRRWEALRTGPTADDGSASLESTLTGPGVLRFLWRVSSETNRDRLTLWLNGVEQAGISGERDWAQETLAVPAGVHVVQWRYLKDQAGAAGDDAGWVDEVAFTAEAAGAYPPALVVDPVPATVTEGDMLVLEGLATGSSPLAYQWRRDGVPLADGPGVFGSRTHRLTLLNLSVSQAGLYSLAVTNASGQAVSAPAAVSVLPPPPSLAPVVTVNPVGRQAFDGGQVTFTVSASGAQPLAFQWQFNGTNLSDSLQVGGASTPTLQLSNLQSSEIGNYSVLVSNVHGVARSTPVALVVLPAASAVGAAYLNLQAAGYTGWVAQTSVAQDGVAALRSGIIPDGQNTRLETWVDGPGTLAFWWKVSSEPVNDQLRFYIGTNEVARISGETEWQRMTFAIPAGASQLLKWRYSKNADTAAGLDAGFVDGIEYTMTGGAVPPVIATAPASQSVQAGDSVALAAAVTGSPAMFFQWRRDGVNLQDGVGVSGARSPRLVLTGVQPAQAGNYALVVSNASGVVTSPEAAISVTPAQAAPLITSGPSSQQALEGATVSFRVVATGAEPLGYAWLFNGVPLADGPGIRGAHAATLELDAIGPARTGQYSARVFNAQGTGVTARASLVVRSPAEVLDAPYLVVASGTGLWLAQTGSTQVVSGTNFGARLTVSIPPAITQHPVSRTVRAGSNVVLSVVATGSQPLSYRWRFNGLNLTDGPSTTGTTTETLTLVDVQAGQAGSYSVLVTNGVGIVLSSNAVVAVNSPPVVTTQPASQTLPENTTVSLSVSVAGTGPFSYQWMRNGLPLANGGSISGATSNLLTIVNAQASHSGTYTVMVTNLVGSTISSNAILVLNTGLTLGEATDASYLGWSTGLGAPWVVDSNIVHLGSGSSRSGAISNNQSSVMSALVPGAGIIRFWWKVSSQTNRDVLTLYVDGAEYASISGEVDWQWRTFTLPEGSQLLQWVYSKDATLVSGQDRGWVDEVDFVRTVGPSAPVITRHPLRVDVDPGATVSFSVEATGSQPLAYQWRYNGVDLAEGLGVDGATAPILTLTGVSAGQAGSYDVVVRNPYSLAQSSNALLRVVPNLSVEDGVDTALDNLNWVLGGFSPWRGQTNVSYDRVDAAESGALPNSRTNWIETTIVGPAAVSFWWKVSSQTNSDRLRFFINGVERASITGETDWRWRTFDVTTPLATLRWAYGKDATGAAGADRAWVDQVRIGPSAPLITNESPRLVVVDQGTTVKMQAEPTGSEPFNYQWRFNGAPLSETGNVYGAISSRRLILTNAQPEQSGVYSVTIANAAGVAISSDFYLTVNRALPLPFALNTPTWVWETGGDAWWVGDTSGSHDGIQTARNGTLGSSDSTWMQTTVVGEGTLRFWWRSSTQPTLDFLAFYINDTELARISGETPWSQRSFDLTGSTNVIRWLYSKDSLVTNGQDRVWVDQVTFGPTPPTITNHPASLAVDSGATVNFRVGHRGTGPFTYTWRRNGIPFGNGGNISGANTAVLTISNVLAAQAGTYSVIVSNAVGGATSANAQLFVTQLVPLAAALDATNLVWATNGSSSAVQPWVGQTGVSYDAIDAARSGVLADNQSASFQTTLAGPGTISFWWRVSSETGRDFLRFYVGSTEVDNLSGEIPWAQRSFSIPAGTQTLRWTYQKNGSLAAGQDRAWVDQVVFTGQPVAITSQPQARSIDVGATATFSVGVSGTPPITYQWRYNGIPLVNGGGFSGVDTATLTLVGAQQVHSGNYSVVVQNSAGSVTSTDALLSVSPTLGLAEALDAPGLVWTTNGAPPWVGTPVGSHDGEDVARGGDVPHSGSTYMQTTVTGPGSIAFWWKVSSETNNDRVTFFLGSTELARLSGEVDWTRAVFTVPSGSQTLRWTYQKNASISAGQDRAWVDEVFFGAVAPTISTQPTNRAVEAGSTTTFSVAVAGTPPFSYQWRYNGTPLVNGGGVSGVTSSNLVLTGLTLSQAGGYSVVVTNSAGAVTSQQAALTVGAVMPLEQALDGSDLSWTNSGNLPWVGQALVSRDGQDAARSGAITHSQLSTMQTTVTGPGTVTYWWKVSSEPSNDRVMFYIGSSEQARLSGEVDWQQRSFPVPAGTQTLRWTYQKNSSTTAGQDRAWVDQVVFVSSLTPVAPSITTQPLSQGVGEGGSVTFTVAAAGTSPMSYQWLLNGTPIAGANAPSHTLVSVTPAQAGVYSCFITNVAGSVTSAGAVLSLLTVGEAVDAPALTWLGAGNAGWIPQTLLSHDGADAAHSGAIADGENSRLETFVNGPGVISFWWKVSCESADNLRFYIGTNELARIAGEVDWEFRTFNVPAGSSVLLKWRYGKSASAVAGQDRGWVDQVTYAASALPQILPPDDELPEPETPQADPPLTRPPNAPIVTRIAFGDSKAVLSWEGNPNRIYRVYYKDSLADTAWQLLDGEVQIQWKVVNGEILVNDSILCTFTDVVPGKSRFYRVLEE